MRTKKFILLVTVLLSLAMAGCGKNEQIQSEEYVAGEDDQPFINGYRDVAIAEDGYYFLSNNFVYYYDFDSKKTHLLCNKPECAHDGDQCNAYINAMSIRYCEHALYYVSCDNIETNEFYLWKMSEDGTEKEKLFFLCAEENEGEMSQGFINQFVVHRGYVYYEVLNMDSEKFEIIKRELKKDSKEEVIYTCEGDNSMAQDLTASGNHLYFEVLRYSEDHLSQDICTYNILKDETDVLQEDVNDAGGITVYNETVYYPSDGVLYSIGKDGKKNTVLELPEDGNMTVYVNEHYISIDNINKLNLEEDDKREDRYRKRCIYLYEKDSGELLTTFKTETSDEFYLCEPYLVLDVDCGWDFQLFSVEQIKKENTSWETLGLNE